MAMKHTDPKSVTFSLFTAEEIRKLSVVKVCTPLAFNLVGHPLPGGLYDPALGPFSEYSDPCRTCYKNFFNCPGHMGHIELPLPVVNPMFYRHIYILLKLSCLNCHIMQIPGYMKHLLITQLSLLQAGYLSEAQEAESLVSYSLSSHINNDDASAQESFNLLVKQKLDEFQKTVVSCSVPVCIKSEVFTKSVESLKNKLLEAVVKYVSETKTCRSCEKPMKKLTFFQNKLMTASQDPILQNAKSKSAITTIMPNEQRDHLRKLWPENCDFITAILPVLKTSSLQYPTDIFFMDLVSVPPPKTRPVNYVDNKMMEHAQTEVYKRILQDNMVLRNVIKLVQDGNTEDLTEEGKTVVGEARGNSPLEKFHFLWQQIQGHVDHLMDNNINQNIKSGKNVNGLKQASLCCPRGTEGKQYANVIEKKQGVIRMNMMGKRVNFAARSVITPDPNLNIDEVGVPQPFATALTYPSPVTTWNVGELREMITNGPTTYPGAVMVENYDGSKIKIPAHSKTQRESIAKRLLTHTEDRDSKGIKVCVGHVSQVHRHLRNGDILLLNRQPTLHKPSIMAHTARILQGEKTLRLHYANCKAYNADFDGDEMNAHFPQSELGRSEAYNLLNVNCQYVVPKDGTPLSGLIQDHVISGVRLSLRGVFFDSHRRVETDSMTGGFREGYQQLVYQGLSNKRGDIELLPPAILKPARLWSGKQVLSTIILNTIPTGKYPINLTGTAKISSKLYGGACSSRILSSFSKLFTFYLQRCGFTLGIEDILILDGAEQKRVEHILASRKVGDELVMSALELDESQAHNLKDEMERVYRTGVKGRAIIDRAYKTSLDTFTNNINTACLPTGLLRKFPDNNLQLMIQSGAKGSTVNAMQISCLLGQIELEGKRPPLMKSSKSLPSFARGDTTPRAGGFIDGRFLTGIQPQEFFFHCMAGREKLNTVLLSTQGLIDTAVKTSRSGYLQRCLIKHLEGLVVHYDQTVRDSDGTVVQFCYGEDGRDVLKSQFFKKERISFLAENCKAIIENKSTMAKLDDKETLGNISDRQKEIYEWSKINGHILQKRWLKPFVRFSADMKNSISPKRLRKFVKQTGRSKASRSLCKAWRGLDSEEKNRLNEKWKHCPDPVTADFRSDCDYGALTEHLEGLMADYKKSKDWNTLHRMISLKSMLSLTPPGEPVGLLAAQSIGEPSTQMTLNTFHFAGRGDMNVTLGIPRLREILMMASKTIKTPSMDIPFRTDVPNIHREANKLRRKLTRVSVASVLEYAAITDYIQLQPQRQRMYTIKLQFLPYQAYRSDFFVKPANILKYVEKKFFARVLAEMKKRLKFRDTMLHTEARRSAKEAAEEEEQLDDPDEPQKEAKSTGAGEDHESSDEESEADDADATLSRTRSKHNEGQGYEDPEEEEESFIEANLILTNFIPMSSTLLVSLTFTVRVSAVCVRMTSIKDESVEIRCQNVVGAHPNFQDYKYDSENELWCEITFGLPLTSKKLDLSTLLKDVAEKSIVWEVPLIRRAFTYENPDTHLLTLKTDGINIQEMFKFRNILDLNKLYSNDIYGVSQTYGIEAARRVIIKEVQDVFKMYGIIVDPRHLLLVGDYMCFNGQFEPFSRKGMEDSTSPFQQMSFEASLNFLKMAALQGKTDMLRSPSSRIMIGRPCFTGTGICSVYQKLPEPSTEW
uniref:DNA-directed RNA polymerase subunit n=1 Tax=Timema shepardi TaxID=629360 RepID=A0A7R9AYG4_TIMSH|nr:unnamed protein product [Timema shepardi]